MAGRRFERWEPVVTVGLAERLDSYLVLRRGLGFRLERPELLLGQFLDHLAAVGETERFTIDQAIDWAAAPAGSGGWHRQRLSAVRGFARYLHAFDPSQPVPPADVLTGASQRAIPYMYSDQDIQALMAATKTLRYPFRQDTYATLIGLLAVTGMRVGEAIRLDITDIDLTGGVLTVRHSKFDKSRLVPVHDTTRDVLAAHLRARRDCPTPPSSPALFLSPAGTRLIVCNVESTFRILVARAGLRPRVGRCRPRMHDLRHRFAVATLLDAYRHDGDPTATMSVLSTYLGHVDPKATYWYLTAAPELLTLAARRLEHRDRGGAR